MLVPATGPADARILVVGEAPGEQEVQARQPFVGAAGYELNKMLHEAGITRAECFITNVCRYRPPGNDITQWIPQRRKGLPEDFVLYRGRLVHPWVAEGAEALAAEIRLVDPNVIIALGNTPLWALTGLTGITSWRGSLLTYEPTGAVLIPTYHPAAVLRQWSWRTVAVHDLKRASAFRHTRALAAPDYQFQIRPSFDDVVAVLDRLEEAGGKLAVDIETRAGHIACLGIAWSRTQALCIPFMCTEDDAGYWSEDEEAYIVWRLDRLLRSPRVEVIGQNFTYDTQYIWRHWGFVPRFTRDTMLAHHTMFLGLPKGLDFLSSMYCAHHVYWKDEGKEWFKNMGEDQLWTYNCKDCVITFEVDAVEQASVDKMGLREPHDFQQRMFWPVLHAMQRGTRLDPELRADFARRLEEALREREAFLEEVLGHPLNPRSPKQMTLLFYGDLAQKPYLNRKTGRPSLDDEALQKVANREPLLRPLVDAILEYRSISVFLGTFVNARASWDGRMRTSYNIAGTETLRLSSSTDAFGSGMNLQNIPKGDASRRLPNVRELFIPDPGHTFFDMDLDRADLQVVVWEADDAELKAMLRAGVDIHNENARTLGVSRQLAKSWVHGTNYGGGPRTMAIACGITVHQAERMRARWFEAHPGIKRWHDRVEASLKSRRQVENRFGYRRIYFDRVEGLLPEALAWIPQSTVAIVINRIWTGLYGSKGPVEVLLQVHDSLAGQFPSAQRAEALAQLHDCAQSVVIPYPEPLVIPVGIKTSEKSWGDCA